MTDKQYKSYITYRDRMKIAEGIIHQMCEDTGISVDNVQSERRTKVLVALRIAIAQKLKAEGMTYQQIGNFLGGRNHATIMNYFRKVA
jgi:chromosomal replication initiation ATPase DnaA